jgi:hypothetical protein
VIDEVAVAALEVELASLERRTDATGVRRASEVREQLAELIGVKSEKPARGGRQSRPRVAAETRGE